MVIVDAADRFRRYVERLIDLLKKHQIKSVKELIRAVRADSTFAAEWKEIWAEIAGAEGGKIGLGTAGAILGATLGGIGIAWGGMAIGLPLALVLGLGGLLAGSEFDAARRLASKRLVAMRMPKELYARIRGAADLSGVSTRELIVRTLDAAFPDAEELKG